jgi:hypothetical protein
VALELLILSSHPDKFECHPDMYPAGNWRYMFYGKGGMERVIVYLFPYNIGVNTAHSVMLWFQAWTKTELKYSVT